MKPPKKSSSKTAPLSQTRRSSLNFSQLVKKIGFNFQNENLIKNAFVHRSYLNEYKGYRGLSNERLEFFGDSIISLIVSKFLFENLAKSSEGELTKLRAALVRTETLAKIASNLELGKYLLLSKGEEESGGRSNISIMANTFEALVGAIYLDLGLITVEKFIKETILDDWQNLAQNAVIDHKSKLQEVLQRIYHQSPSYKLISSWGPDHEREFEIGVYLEEKLLGRGAGKNKQQAAQNAAKAALSVIKKMP